AQSARARGGSRERRSRCTDARRRRGRGRAAGGELPCPAKAGERRTLRDCGAGRAAAPPGHASGRWSCRRTASAPRARSRSAVVDLAAMRDAMAEMRGDPSRINPLVPAELVIDHSVQVDAFGTREAFRVNAEREFERNRERYAFLRWGQGAFDNFSVVPPDTG